MKAKEHGIIGGLFFLTSGIVSVISIFIQAKGGSAPLSTALTIICDTLFISGALFTLLALKQITLKLRMFDTHNKFLYGFGMLSLSGILSFGYIFELGFANNKWYSLGVATSFFIAAILLIVAFLRMGKRSGIKPFTFSSYLLIAMVIIPPYIGEGGKISNIAYTLLYATGNVLLIAFSVLLFVSFIQIKQSFKQ